MSIPHYSALSRKRQLEFLNNHKKFTCQEKLDGTNFIYGCTDGVFWASRKSGDKKYYHPDEWGFDYWTTNFREAHSAMDNIRINLGLGDNFEIEGEILNYMFPNTIVYENSAGDQPLNQLVFFRGVEHTLKNSSFRHMSFSEVNNIPITEDGVTTERTSRVSKWFVSSLTTWSTSWLDRLFAEISAFDDPVKENERLIEMTNSFHSAHGTNQIEGLVFKHEDGWQLKLVDRERFTAENKANYEWRKRLFKTPGQKTDSVMDVYTRDVRDGMSEHQAKAKALEHLNKVFFEYLDTPRPTMKLHVHIRNLEAFAALRMQFGA